MCLIIKTRETLSLAEETSGHRQQWRELSCQSDMPIAQPQSSVEADRFRLLCAEWDVSRPGCGVIVQHGAGLQIKAALSGILNSSQLIADPKRPN